MKTSQQGRDFIKKNEGTVWNKTHDRMVAYDDGYGFWTIGYGHHDGSVKRGDEITIPEAELLLVEDLESREIELTKRLSEANIEVNQNQFDALMDFVFNIKGGVNRLITTTLWKKLCSGDFNGAADEFLRWCYVGKVKSKGLLKRRERERELFLTV